MFLNGCEFYENRYSEVHVLLRGINEIVFYVFYVHGSVHRKNVLIYIQQDATLHSLSYLETALHVSGGTTTHHQERKRLYLQYLVFFTPLLLPAAIAAGSNNGLTNTRCCRYGVCAADDGWWYHPKHVEQLPDK
jgi:hypothetical protein